MKKIKIDDPRCLENARQVIEGGGIAVVPTDTVYGLACDATNSEAVMRLIGLKGRTDSGKYISIFADDISMVDRYAIVDDSLKKILGQLWPGALTAVLFQKGGLAMSLSNNRTIGIRVPRLEFINNLVRDLDVPITATSANKTGYQPLLNVDSVDAVFTEGMMPDIVIDAGHLPDNIVSTVVDFTKKPPTILREGPVAHDIILMLYDKYTI